MHLSFILKSDFPKLTMVKIALLRLISCEAEWNGIEYWQQKVTVVVSIDIFELFGRYILQHYTGSTSFNGKGYGYTLSKTLDSLDNFFMLAKKIDKILSPPHAEILKLMQLSLDRVGHAMGVSQTESGSNSTVVTAVSTRRCQIRLIRAQLRHDSRLQSFRRSYVGKTNGLINQRYLAKSDFSMRIKIRVERN